MEIRKINFMKTEGHIDSYRQFLTSFYRDLEEGEDLIKPIVQNALLLAFHLIEAVLAEDGLHVNKHQLLPRTLRTDPRIRILSDDEKQKLANLFEEVEFLRPARVYGGKGDGKALKEISKLVKDIKGICYNHLSEKYDL